MRRSSRPNKTAEHDGNENQPSINDLAGTAGLASELGSLSTDVKETLTSATRAVRQQASDFAADIGHELSKTAEDQKARGVEAIQSLARAISSAADELENQSPRAARTVRDAAEKVEALSKNVSNRNIDELMTAATDFARSQPMLFIGGAVMAGFALSRFIKSSAELKPSAPLQPNMSSET